MKNSLLIILSPVLLMFFSILIDNYSSIAVYAQLAGPSTLSADGTKQLLEKQEEEKEEEKEEGDEEEEEVEDRNDKNNNNNNDNNNYNVPFALPIPFP